jgi:hemerythrin-like domain-containing protein
MRREPLSRRQLLVSAGAGMALGAAATETANLLTRSNPAPSAVIPPGESLMYEHGVLKRLLLVYQAALPKIDDSTGIGGQALHQAAQIVHDYIEGFHEAIEEGYVFPALAAANILQPTINTLLEQHSRGRQITQFLLANTNATFLATPAIRDKVIAATNAFITMYQPHEAREDTVIYPAFRQLLTPKQLEQTGQSLLRLQTEQFGPNALTTITAKVAAIESVLDINDLEQFTAPPIDDGPSTGP